MNILIKISYYLFFLALISCNEKESQIDVMTYNIRLDLKSDNQNSWDFRKAAVTEMLNYYSPDIIGFQELLKNQLDDLKNKLSDYQSFGVGRTDGKEQGEYTPIFFKKARFEKIDGGNFSLSENPENFGEKSWDTAYPRIASWLVLNDKLSRKKVFVLNTHLDNVSELARQNGIKLIISKIKDLAPDIPVYVTGDFNALEDSQTIKILEENAFHNSSNVSKISYGQKWTFHDFGRLPIEQRTLIDYIFVSKQIEVLKYRIINDNPDGIFLSDHNPILIQTIIK